MNEKKDENPVGLLKDQQIDPIVHAYFELCHLKQLYRQGWLCRGVSKERCESVAEHSFACAVLVIWLAPGYPQHLDVHKALRMALVHDLGEIYAGDIIPSEAIPADEKHRLEAGSIERLLTKVPAGEAILSLWEEFEQGTTIEARFVHQIDRLEMGLQAGVYAAQGLLQPEEFLDSARRSLEAPTFIQKLDAIQIFLQHNSGFAAPHLRA